MPAGFGDVFAAAFRTWWRTLSTTVPATLLVLVPAYVVAFAIQATIDAETLDEVFGTGNGDIDVDEDELVRAAIVVLISVLITAIAQVVAFAVAFKAIVAGYAGARSDVRSTVSHGFARGGSAFWLAVLVFGAWLAVLLAAGFLTAVAAAVSGALAVLVGIVAFVGALVVFIWLGVSWSVALPVVLVDEARGRRALARSRELVSGVWWQTFAILLVAVLAIGFGGFVIGFVVGIPFVAAESAVARAFGSNLSGVVSGTLSTPLWAAFAVVLYFDFRFRKEGITLDDAARSVGAERDASTHPLAPLADPAAPWRQAYPPPPPPTYPPPPDEPPR